jgi:hypothetical protein
MRRRFLSWIAALAAVGLAGPAWSAPVTTIDGGPAGYVCTLTLTIGTGDDDLRGGDDNLQAWVLLPFGARGAPIWLSLSDLINAGPSGINARQNWSNWSTHSVTARLPDCSVRSDAIHGLRLMTHATGGVSGDNWNLQSVSLTWSGYVNPPGAGLNPPRTGNVFSSSEPRRQTFLFRFTGRTPIKEFDW